MPMLPKEETKIVERPQSSLDTAGVGAPTVITAIFVAVGITGEESTICPKPQQNIVISISKRANVDRYTKIRQIYIQGKHHEVNTYETAPHNKSKAVIHGIPVKGGPKSWTRLPIQEIH